MEGLIEGRIVHYMPSGPAWQDLDRPRPAVIVRVWDNKGMCNLRVFTDGANDASYEAATRDTYARAVAEIESGTFWATSANYDDSAEPAGHTWHWPPRS